MQKNNPCRNWWSRSRYAYWEKLWPCRHYHSTNEQFFRNESGSLLVIEVLKEEPIGQINTMGNFISRTNFWEAKWDVSDGGERGYQALLEANHQRWWCPKYTSDTKGSNVVANLEKNCSRKYRTMKMLF